MDYVPSLCNQGNAIISRLSVGWFVSLLHFCGQANDSKEATGAQVISEAFERALKVVGADFRAQ